METSLQFLCVNSQVGDIVSVLDFIIQKNIPTSKLVLSSLRNSYYQI